jgi:hypothetical protein
MPRLPVAGLGAHRRHRAGKPIPTATTSEKQCHVVVETGCQRTDAIFDAYQIGYGRGYDEGLKAGRKEGLRAGRRRAKGKPEYARPHGGQKLLCDVWALQFFDFVEECTVDGKISLHAAADEYLRRSIRYLRKEGLNNNPNFEDKVFTLESTKARAGLVRLYRRIKKGTDSIDPEIRKQFVVIKRHLSEA